MDCVSCGAPLPAKSNICTHCQTLNDVDLRAIQLRSTKGPTSDRNCPRCETRMESISLGLEEEFYIERCDRCLGIFFDPAELEFLIDKSVSAVYEVDRQRLQKLINEEYHDLDKEVKYIKCPACKQLMNRRIYGKKSGVIVDTCRDHGVWLDGGELGQILKWAKAGGRIYDAEAKNREEEETERKKRTEARTRVYETPDTYSGSFHTPHDYGLACLLRVLFLLFR